MFQRVKFDTFVLSKYSLYRSGIGNKGGVALGEALKVNKTLQILK